MVNSIIVLKTYIDGKNVLFLKRLVESLTEKVDITLTIVLDIAKMVEKNEFQTVF